MPGNYITPGKSYSVRFEPKGIWNATVVRVDEDTNQAWVRVPRMTGDLDRGPIAMPALATPLAEGDDVLVAFREGRQEDLVILAKVGGGGGSPSGAAGWLPVTLPTAEEDWTLQGTPSFAAGQVTFADGEFLTAEGLTGAGAALLEQARPMLQRVTLRARVSDASTASTLNVAVNYNQTQYPTPAMVRYGLWESTPDIIGVSLNSNDGPWGYLTADPEEWHTLTWIAAPYTGYVHFGLFGVQINDEWASWNHANASSSVPGNSFNLHYESAGAETITVDLNESFIELKPLW